MFDWLGEILSGFGNAVGDTITAIGDKLSTSIFDAILKWLYEMIYGAVADFFEMISAMGAEIFDLPWVQATIRLFVLFGWALFAVGTVIACFDLAVEYQNGRANIRSTFLNVLKGFFAAGMLGTVPVELYRFCISLQNTLSHDLSRLFAGAQTLDLARVAKIALEQAYKHTTGLPYSPLTFLSMIAFGYCVVKIFFANIKRGGILLVQMAVGSLYLFSVPRGYTDGFNQWVRQVIALCLTAFLQTTLLYLGLMTFRDNMLMGLGVMLAAGEVPRVAQQFGLDSSVKVNMTQVVHTTQTAVNVARTVANIGK